MSWLMVIVGNCIYALSVKLFVLPANLISCGTTGIALTVEAPEEVTVTFASYREFPLAEVVQQ